MKIIDFKMLAEKTNITEGTKTFESKLSVQLEDMIYHTEFSLAEHAYTKLRLIHSEGKMKEQMRLELAKRLSIEIAKHVYSVLENVKETKADEMIKVH